MISPPPANSFARRFREIIELQQMPALRRADITTHEQL
jgi:hypothetical protein